MARVYLLCFLLTATAQSGFAQFLPFGKNKVQYNPEVWKKIETPHFRIFYYDSLKDVAAGAAIVVEEAYKKYVQDFGQTVNYHIPLIIYNTHNHFSQTNVIPGILPEGVGGFFEYIKGRVVIPFNGSVERFHHVLRHELVHVFTNSAVNRLLKERRMATDRYPPLWYTEGLAEFLSHGVDAQGEMVMRDAVIHGYFPRLRDFDRIRGSYLMYKGGQVFLEFISQLYDSSSIMQLLHNLWVSPDYEKVIEQTLGESISVTEMKWFDYLGNRFNRNIVTGKISNTKATVYTPVGYHFSPSAVHSKENTVVYFLSNIDGYTSIFSSEAGKTPFKLPETPQLELRGEKEADYEAFHLMQRSLTAYKDSLLCFISRKGGRDQVYFYSLLTKEVVHVFSDSSIISVSDPIFFSESPIIAFRGIGINGNSDIYTYSPITGILKQKTTDPYDDFDPSFTAEGEIIFASSGRLGDAVSVSNIFLLNASNNIKRITQYSASLKNPVLLSQDTLFFLSDFSGVFQGYSYVLPKQKTIQQLTNNYTGILDPSLSNNHVFYTVYTAGSFTIQSVALQNGYSIQDTFPTSRLTGNNPQIARKFSTEESVYEREYDIDFAATQFSSDPVYGSRGGGALTMSDLLGDDSYEFVLYNTAEVQSDFLKSFNVAISRYLSTPQWNFSYGVFHFNGRRYDLRESDDYFFERSYGTFFGLLKPLSFFTRVEFSLSLINSEKELFGSFDVIKSTLLSNSVSIVHDNTLWYGTGAIDGYRYRFLAGYTSDIKNSEVNYLSLIGDYRHYLRLGLLTSLAFRAGIYYNEGKSARRYIMGGSWDLRGYPRFSLRGEKMWITSVELRTPLIDQFLIRLPAFYLPLGMVRGAVFFDAGSTWDKKYNETYGSIGFGFRINLFNALALRYDMGKTIEGNFSRLQKGLFYQFFFGWDF